MTTAPRFGVNYVPSQGWWYSWVDWDAAAIERDLQAIAGLEADHIRIHCLWPLFQPNPSMVSPVMLARLVELLDLAAAAGLDVVVTVFNGWLSGFDFRPSWVNDGDNIFTEPSIVESERALIRAIAAAVGEHPRFLGFDLANEPSVLATDTKNVTTQAEGDAWVADLLEPCEQLVPDGTHTVGMDHMPWLNPHSAFSRSALATAGSVTSIHAWVFFTGALERYGPAGTGTLHLAEYMLELAKAFSRDPKRPVWLQEFGVAPEWMSPDQLLDFVEAATRISATVDGVWAVTYWCSHDIDRELGGFVELEYDLGLLTVDNVLKPSGERIRGAMRAIRAAGATPPVRTVALVLPDAVVPDLAFADHFFALVDQGVCPAIVLASRANDGNYLAQRGIEKLVRVGGEH